MLTIVCVWCFDCVEDWLPHEEGHVEGEWGQEADVEEHDDHQVPLPGHAGPHQVLLKLEIVKIRIILLKFNLNSGVNSINNIIASEACVYSDFRHENQIQFRDLNPAARRNAQPRESILAVTAFK